MKSRAVFALLGAALGVLSFTAAAPGARAAMLPRARDGVASFAICWGSAPAAERLGARVQIAIANENGTLQLLRNAEPRPVVLAYMHMHLSSWDPWRGETEHEESAFVHDPEGRRVHGKAGFALMDPAAAAWRRILSAGARGYVERGTDGVFVDGPSREVSAQLPDRAVPADVAARWASGTAGLLRALVRAVGPRGAVVYNGLHEDWAPFTRATSGGLLEGYTARPWSLGGAVDGTLWQGTQDAVLHAQRVADGQLLYAVGPVDDVRLRLYAVASYLLVRGRRTFFAYGADSRTSGYFPEWDAAIGRPLDSFHEIGEARLASGLYRRRFTRGVVFVNPSSTRTIAARLSSPARLVVPAGGVIGALGGNGHLATRRATSVTLAPLSGAVLLR